MDTFQRLIAATGQAFDQSLLQHPLIGELRSGRIGHRHYMAYLRETWHLVRHTPRIFSMAAAGLRDDRRELRTWLLEQAEEENNHDLLCVADLRRLGEDPQALLKRAPGAGVWGLVTQDYYFASIGDAVCLLGTASLSEQIGANAAQPVMELLQKALDVPLEAFGFIRSHGVVDSGHLESVRKVINRWVGEADFNAVVDARLRAIGYSAQVLSDILEAGG
jgi:hypothetical protein